MFLIFLRYLQVVGKCLGGSCNNCAGESRYNAAPSQHEVELKESIRILVPGGGAGGLD